MNVFHKIRKKNRFAKRANQTKIPLRRKFNFRTIIPGKKFPKIWITSQGCPCVLSIEPKFPKSWYENFRRRIPKKWKLLNFRKANRSTESSGNSGMKIKLTGNFRKIRSKIWVYPTRLSSFWEILQILYLLFSASS